MIKTTINDFLSQINEAYSKIPKTKLNGVFYHGSVIVDDDELFDEFILGYSDWDAIWLTSDENVAKEYSDENVGYDGDGIRFVLRVKLKANAIADISYDLAMNLINKWDLDDFRDSIDILKDRKYNGWITKGSIGKILYDDIAIFYTELMEILDVTLMIDGKWSDYMKIEDANELILKQREVIEE